MSMVTPSTALTTRRTDFPLTSLSSRPPPPRSKWTFRSRMARSSLPFSRSIGGGIVCACGILVGCWLISDYWFLLLNRLLLPGARFTLGDGFRVDLFREMAEREMFRIELDEWGKLLPADVLGTLA